MAQAADYSKSQEDPSLSSEDTNQGKTSLLGKLKEKTKDKTNRLKTKLRSSPKTGDNNAQEDNTYGSSDDEPEMEANNAVSGVTQPEYERQLSDGQHHHDEHHDVEGSPATPAKNFPGNFAGIADDKVKTDSSLAKDFQGLSTKDTSEPMETQPSGESRNTEDLDGSRPMKQKIMDNVSSTKDRTKNMLTPNSAGSEQQYTSPDSAPASEEAQQVGDKATEAGRTWSQWAAERVGLAKDTASEKVGAAKEAAAANAPATAEGKPIHEEAYGAAVEKTTAAKDSVAAQMPDRSEIPSDPAEQTYGQKAAGGFYGAKDKLFTSTQPGEHDKALSQKVTETVGNLPATLKTSFGFGGGASTPTTTPTTSDAPLSSSTEKEAPGAPPQSPGIVSRITGLFGGAKKPATDDSTPSEPAISETGPETQTPVSESTNTS
ncbi:unnamed protein product [Calypogeia fissa]